MALTQVNSDDSCIATACPSCGAKYKLIKRKVFVNKNRVMGYVCLNCNAQFTGTVSN